MILLQTKMFFASTARTKTLLNTTGLTRFGNLTGGTGLNGLFDGVTSTAFNVGPFRNSAGSGYGGVTFTSAQPINEAQITGSSDRDFGTSNVSMTAYLYGKSGSAPASGTDGTSLGSTTWTDGGTQTTKTITSSDTTTSYDHMWVYILSTDGADNIHPSEFVFYTMQ